MLSKMRGFVVLSAVFVLACGFSIHKPVHVLDNRIIDGSLADIQEVPYQVALLRDNGQICGGSIISDYWVLTAAHCVEGTHPNRLTVRVGSSLWQEGGSLHQVIDNVWHPQYNLEILFDYDYALLKVGTPFPIGQAGVAPIELDYVDPVGGEMALVSGWGQDYYRVHHLKKTDVPIVSRAECREVYGQSAVTENMLCAGWYQGGFNTCYGDSGGPLVVNGRQVGIVSWAVGCALGGYPTVFGDVANQRDWIRSITGV